MIFRSMALVDLPFGHGSSLRFSPIVVQTDANRLWKLTTQDSSSRTLCRMLIVGILMQST